MKRLALLVAVLACSKSDQAPPAPAKPTFDKLTISLDGAPLAIDRAFLKRTSPDVVAVSLGAGKGSCDVDAGVSFMIAKRVAPAGHESFVITDLWSRDVELDPPDPPVKVTLDGTKLVLPPIKTGKLAISGEVTAVDCGAVQPTGIGAPKQTHKSKATITVAGKSLPVQGVTVQTRPGVAATDVPNITISTNVKDCSAVALPAPVILERIDTKWSLRGTWFAEPIAETDANGLVFNANGVGTSADGPVLELQLSGTGKLGDYAVKLEGTAEAIECVR